MSSPSTTTVSTKVRCSSPCSSLPAVTWPGCFCEEGAYDSERACSRSWRRWLTGRAQRPQRRRLMHRDASNPATPSSGTSGERPSSTCATSVSRSPKKLKHTHTTGVVGTFEYMAPERHRGEDADERSDVYSLGCLLWAALTGEAPYRGTSEIQVAIAHMQEPVPAVDTSRPAFRVLEQEPRYHGVKAPWTGTSRRTTCGRHFATPHTPSFAAAGRSDLGPHSRGTSEPVTGRSWRASGSSVKPDAAVRTRRRIV